MKYALFLLTFCCSTLALQAQEAKAMELLEDSQKMFASLKDFSADIQYTLENPNLVNPIIKSGQMVLSGDKFKLSYNDERTYCNGKYTWEFFLRNYEGTISHHDPNEGNEMDKFYRILGPNVVTRYDGMEGNLHKVSLFLNNDDSEFYQVNYWINDLSKLIDKAVFHAKTGSTMSYGFTNAATNSGVPERIFTPNMADYQEFDIIDLR